MDSALIAELTSKLGDDIEGLKESLEPLNRESLNETASKLPLLDRAKLYSFAAYSLESVLFLFREFFQLSNLRLQGVDVQTHPVFTELTRVRQYFDKIKAAEAGSDPLTAAKSKMSLDKPAVQRILRHDLASNFQGTKRRFRDSGAEDSGSAGDAAISKKSKDGHHQRGGSQQVSAGAVDDVESLVDEASAAVAAKPVVSSAGKDTATAADPQDDYMALDERGKKQKKQKKGSGGGSGRKGKTRNVPKNRSAP